MKDLYKYKRLYFRKPLFTKDNLRFFFITGTVALFIFTTIFISMNWAIHLPAQAISEKITSKYLSFLVEEKVKFQPEINTKSTPHLNEIYDDIKTTEFDQITDNLTPVDRTKRTFPPKEPPEEFHNTQNGSLDYSKYLGSNPGELVKAAIDNIPGLIREEIVAEKKEQQLNFNNEVIYFEHFDRQIRIPQPEVMKFASSNGNRNPDDTFAILENNEIDIKHCFEKYSRYYPDFSGDIKISFTIHPEGHVIPASIKIVNSNIRDPRIINCIKKSIQRWKNFPAIAFEDGIFTITRKYIF